MELEWLNRGESLRRQNNKTISDYETLLEQEKERVEREEAAAEINTSNNNTPTVVEETNTNAIGNETDETITGVADAIADFEEEETNSNNTVVDFQLNEENINSLSEKYPENQKIGDLQGALQNLLQEGKNIEDLPDDLQVQLKEILEESDTDKATQNNNERQDSDLLKAIDLKIEDGESAYELFQQELLREAETTYGDAELISEETDEDGNVTKKFKADDGTEFSVVEINRGSDIEMELNYDDGSKLKLSLVEDENKKDLSLTRTSKPDEESGEKKSTTISLEE